LICIRFSILYKFLNSILFLTNYNTHTDPEVERLGANATIQHAQQYWDTLCVAARQDGLLLDPLWDMDDPSTTTEDDTDDDARISTTTAFVNNQNDNNDRNTRNNPTLSCQHTKEILFTQNANSDYRLYCRFRSNIGGYWNVASIKMGHLAAPPITSVDDDHHHHHHPDDDGAIRTSFTNSVIINPLGGPKWTSLLLACDGVVPDYNFITLLRANCMDVFTIPSPTTTTTIDNDDENTKNHSPGTGVDDIYIVPRAQFICIELARCREGYYNRAFRQMLQQYDMKTMDDILKDCLLPFVSSIVQNNTNHTKKDDTSITQNNNNNNDSTERLRRMMHALHRLSTEWPFPSIHTLRDTGIVRTVQRILRTLSPINNQSNSNSHPLHSHDTVWMQSVVDACSKQLQNWHDLIQLRKISNTLSNRSNTHSSSINSTTASKYSEEYRSTIQRMLQKLVSNHSYQHDHNGNDTNSSNTTNYALSNNVLSKQQYVTKTTCNISDLLRLNGTVATSTTTSVRTTRDASTLFADYGMMVLSNFCTSQQIQDCNDQAQLALRRLQEEQLTPRHLILRGENTFDFVEVRQRPGHRVDNRYTILDDPNSPISRLGRQILSTVTSQLFRDESTTTTDSSAGTVVDTDESSVSTNSACSTWKLLYAGVVHAFPRSNPNDPPPPSQLWHRDGPSLFETTTTKQQHQHHHHHPTHCFNVFVPLIDVHAKNGTTEFVPGTHEDKRYNHVVADIILNQSCSIQDAGIVRADVPAGSLIVFDVRILHRGLSNQSNIERPVLYFTFCRDWFQEQHMFQKTESLLQNPKYNFSNSFLQSTTKLCEELYTTVTGKLPPPIDTSEDHHGQCNLDYYGHPHYTTRFDLLLLEQWNTNNACEFDTHHSHVMHVSAMTNYTAVLRFCNLTNSEKALISHEFIRVLTSYDAWDCKKRTLEQVRQVRHQRQLLEQSKGRRSDVDDEQHDDFASIQRDMSDVTALYELTAQLLFSKLHLGGDNGSEESRLSQLGFTEDDKGLCIVLALLKAYSNSITTGNETPDFPTAAELEETFTSWWHAAPSASRFHLISSHYGTTEADLPRKVLVVFSSLGSGLARPEWHGTLNAVGVYDKIPNIDVLHVMDYAYSWYCQDPSCTWNGGEYYMDELRKRLQPYTKILFLGDSMGGAAALRFSQLAHTVIAFTPQIDVVQYDAVTRKDFTIQRREQFRNEILHSVFDESNKSRITVHYGDGCVDDVQQVQQLIGHTSTPRENLDLVAHNYDDHILSLHLRKQGLLIGLINDAIQQFVV
jgi:hypothetical protein